MQALMLAAGMGKRLGKYTNENTKCMVEVAGKKLIDRAIEALKYADIKKFIVVIGYKGDLLKKYLEDNYDDIEFIFVENKEFDKTNNIYSLYLAKDYLKEDDTVILESDLIYQIDVIKKLVDSDYKDAAIVAKYEQWMDGTVVFLDESDNITEFIEKKNFIHSKIHDYYKTVNIYKFSKDFSKKYYLPFINAYIEAYGNNEYYELVLKAIAHLSKSELKGFRLNNELWYEIDDAQDLDIADTMFSEGNNKLENFQKRYGGYWRFPKTKDFCYLVNPYFPKNNMIEKFKCNFYDLFSQYPSGMQVQRVNAAKMFNIDKREILVGNGASELINCLGRIIKGKTLVPVPSFNEYIRCFTEAEIVPLNTAKYNFKLTPKSILEKIEEVDNVVLVNPDNPTGSFLKYDEIIEIIDKCYGNNKTVVIDESFIDFAHESVRYTLIDSDILKKYPNLIVIKSISKSYGIPGLRLGVLATFDESIISKMNRLMPVWNINSLGEYFFQIINLYQNDYFDSCNKIAEERHDLICALKEMPGITPYPSEANYVLCSLSNMDSKELASKLLCDYNIFVKDLSDKEGFNGGSYLRLAVRNSDDNKCLINAFNEILKY
ncbi:MAG: aminotransferase class I/II-fold pyridoxal phosphate-dependent enzyme [Solirubrobacterales bacterium]